MKNTLLLSFLLMGAMSLSGQQTAMDWTRTECGTTNEHHLFAELDSGYVIIVDFVMMNCPSCVNATIGIKNILAEYEISHPGKVRFYSVGFNNSTTCAQLIEWKANHNFRYPVFEQGAEETAYYGGMGMPTIVVLGGGLEHNVYYNDFGYAPSHDPAIKAAVDQAISESGVTAVTDIFTSKLDLSVNPNPFTESLSIKLPVLEVTHLVLTDLMGREIFRQYLESSAFNADVVIQTGKLQPGIWIISLYNGLDRLGIEKVIKK